MQASAGTAELARKLGGFVAYAMRATDRDFLRDVSELDLSLTQLKALHCLGAKDEISLTELAESLGLSLPATSRAVDGLVTRGLVERHEDPEDRRSRRVASTAQGQNLVEELIAMRVTGLEQLLASFSPSEREKLEEALDLILQREEIRRMCPRKGAR